jgi:WhiB family transcriptional regulator, redox-sensing transcriptional regulator
MSVRTPRPATRVRSETNHEWMAQGACRATPEVDFFPNDGAGVAAAQKVCANCPVRRPCLEFALDLAITHGVWGGTSDRQRQRMRTRRAG